MDETIVQIEEVTQAIVIIEDPTIVEVQDNRTIVEIKEEVVSVLTIGIQGPPGIPGTSQSNITKSANGSIGGGRAISLDNTDRVVYADKDNNHRVIGISLNAGNDGDNIGIQLAGEIQEPSWNWISGQPIYLSNNGIITQAPPTSGYLIELGFAVTTNKILLSIKTPIKLT